MPKTKRSNRYLTKAVKLKIMAEAAREYGRIGGLRRSQNLTAKERRAIATTASKAAAEARRKRAAERRAKKKS